MTEGWVLQRSQGVYKQRKVCHYSGEVFDKLDQATLDLVGLVQGGGKRF